MSWETTYYEGNNVQKAGFTDKIEWIEIHQEKTNHLMLRISSYKNDKIETLNKEHKFRITIYGIEARKVALELAKKKNIKPYTEIEPIAQYITNDLEEAVLFVEEIKKNWKK